jgi:hypothetical protein
MHEKAIAIREVYIALEIIRRRCEPYPDLKDFPGNDIDLLMKRFSETYMDQPD